jgi:four helix bundle protein
VEVFRTTGESAWDREWALKDQMRRAALSIPSNIAEGYERGTAPEFKRFSMIAKGSCGELRTQLYVAQALALISKDKATPLLKECREISSMIVGLIQGFKPRKSKTK